MVTGIDQVEPTSSVRQRLRTAADKVTRLQAELAAERQLRDAAIVEAYEAHVRVDTIATDAHVSRARVIAIVGTT